MCIFPPFIYIFSHSNKFLGYSFIFDPSFDYLGQNSNLAQIDFTRLGVQILATIFIAFVGYIFFNDEVIQSHDKINKLK
jgi:hypothetical protein